METTARHDIWVSFSTCSYIIEAEGAIMGHHGTPLSVVAAPRGSHFVLTFHFQRLRRASHFHVSKQVSRANSDQPARYENARKKVKDPRGLDSIFIDSPAAVAGWMGLR